MLTDGRMGGPTCPQLTSGQESILATCQAAYGPSTPTSGTPVIGNAVMGLVMDSNWSLVMDNNTPSMDQSALL